MRSGCPFLVAAAVVIPTLAHANVYFNPVGAPPYYEGGLYRYQVSALAEPYNVLALEVNLQGFLQLVNVYSPDGTPILSGTNDTCGSAGNLPYSESATCTSAQGCVAQSDVVATSSAGDQLVTITPSMTFTGFEQFEILVRFCGAATCETPTATFTVPPLSPRIGIDAAAPLACGQQIELSVSPSSLDAPRDDEPAPAILDLVGDAGGSAAVVTASVFDPAVVAAAFSCAPPGGALGDCTGAFAAFATLEPVSESPVQMRVTAVNSVDPVTGDGRIVIDADALLGLAPGTLAAIPEIPVRVERSADTLAIEVRNQNDVVITDYEVPAGGRLFFEVASATNALGGYEPRTATWNINSAAFDDATPAPSTAGWLTPGADGRERATLDIPATVFDAGGTVLTLQMRAIHDNPDSTTTEAPFVVEVRADAPVVGCRIVLEANEASTGTAVGLALERVTPTGVEPVVADVVWEWPPLVGSIVATPAAQDGFAFHYNAPDESPPEGTVSIGATAPVCPAPPPPVVLSIRDRLGLELMAEPAEAAPGGVVRLRARLKSTAADVRRGLRFVLDLGPGLKPLRRVAVAESNVRTRPLDDELGEALVAFAADVIGDGEAELSLPVMARAGFAGTTPRATLRVYYAADVAVAAEVPVGSAGVSVRILDDPELSESTLIGKVFHDRNGDGAQQEGEPGLVGAMVALATGVYAITDEQGKYHIARLAPGRHAVKINVATLPMGAELTTDEVRALTLTPGVFSKVSFGVRLPDLGDREPLVVAPDSGLVFVEGKPVYRAHFTGVIGARLVARHLEQQRLAEVEKGGAVLELPVGDDSVWTLVERADDGRLYASSFAVFVYPREQGGTLVVPWGPRPVVHMLLPPPTRRVSVSELVLAGESPAGGTVEISSGAEPACTLEVEAGGDVRCDVHDDSIDELVLRVDPAPDAHGVDGPRQAIQVPVFVERSSHFVVAHLDVELGLDLGGDDLLWPDGGAAFLYKGHTANGWELTAGADARVREVFLASQGNQLRNFGAQLFKHDPTRVFRDLDPEEYYPSYGDSSRTVDERESGGRFFLRAQKEKSYVKWGGINTAIDDAEYGRFVRSLYGFGGVLDVGDPELRLTARGFAAQPDTVAARDELTVTGGSLYFLGHKGVVEGSLRVTLEMLDEVSGLPVRATPLTEGIDYEADYTGGRIMLDSALPYRMFGSRLTSDGAGGGRGRLLVEYEYLGLAASDWSLGGRVVGTWGPVSLGATGVAELTGLVDDGADLRSRYWLGGGTLRVDLGEPLRLRLEAAHSDGGSVDSGRSADGGLSFSSRVTGAGKSGNAISAELATGVAGAHAGLYGRYVEPGFSDTHTAPGQRLVQGGLRIDTEFASGTRLWGNYDHRETRLRDTGLLSDSTVVGNTRLVVRELGLLGASQRIGPVDVSVEGRYEAQPKDNRRRAVVGAEVSYHLSSGFDVSLRRRQLVDADRTTRDGSSSGETAAGVLLHSDGWRLAAEAGASDDADLFGRAQATVPVTDDTELYAGYQVTSHLGVGLVPSDDEAGTRVVAGGRRNADDGTVLYSEQSLAMDGSDRLLTRTVGAKVPLSQRTHMSVSYERGALDRDDTLSANSRLRDAVGVGAGFSGERLSARLAADGRLDRQGVTRGAELAAHGRLDFRATDDLTLALAGRGGSGYAGREGDGLDTTRQAWEGAVGFALRPISTDTLNVFGRYALVYERDRLEGDGPWLRSTSQVIALALLYDVWGPFAISPKVAYRNTRVTGVGVRGTDQALLAALRGDLHLTGSWDATLEGRACAAPGAGTDARFGALAEVSLLVLEWLRLGGGYNFSSISASGVQCQEPGARGLFLRAEAIY